MVPLVRDKPSLSTERGGYVWWERDTLRVGWLNGFSGAPQEQKILKDTYPESYITKYTSVRKKKTRAQQIGGLK